MATGTSTDSSLSTPDLAGTAALARPAQLPHKPRRSGWPFVIPAILLLLLLNIFPLIFSIVMSFSNITTDNGLTLTRATLDNWRVLLHDSSFWDSLRFTVEFVIVAVAIEFLAAFAMALLLWRPIRGGAFFRVLFSIPMMLAPVAIGFMFRMLLNEQYGPIDTILRGLHLPTVLWLSDTHTAPVSVLIMDIWEWTPLLFLLLLAGLQAMPEEVLEAARLDGATGFRVIWSVIFPIVAPISVMAVFLRMIDAFTIFGQIYLLTGGGPGSSTTSTTLYAYYNGFQSFNISYGSSISLALLIFVTVLALVYLGIARRLLRRVEA
jgi:multiple sugar transport system permease protein